MKIIVLLVSFLETYVITKESIKYLPTLAKVAKTRKLVKAMIKRLKKSDIQRYSNGYFEWTWLFRYCCLWTTRIGYWLIQQQLKKVIPQSSSICPKQHGAFSIKKKDHSRECRYPSYAAYYLIHFLSLWVGKQFLRIHGDHCMVGHPYMQSELKNMCIW